VFFEASDSVFRLCDAAGHLVQPERSRLQL
jgi:hypothetical protein